MTIQYQIEQRVQRLKSIEEEEKKWERLPSLPPLTRELERASDNLTSLMGRRTLWSAVYQQLAFPTDRQLKQTWHRPLEKISQSADIFDLSDKDFQAFQSQAQAVAEQIDAWDRELKKRIADLQKEKLNTLETARILLNIPDLFENNAERQKVQALLDDMAGLLRLEKVQESEASTLSRRWQGVWQAYQGLQGRLSFTSLQERFHLSGPSVKVLEQLLRGDTLRLSGISPQVLDELRQVQRFAAQISLRLEAK